VKNSGVLFVTALTFFHLIPNGRGGEQDTLLLYLGAVFNRAMDEGKNTGVSLGALPGSAILYRIYPNPGRMETGCFICIIRRSRPGETIHIICGVKDTGTPPLTRYQRVVV
jgi:hypothetical protein